jgi:hypothetical protein
MLPMPFATHEPRPESLLPVVTCAGQPVARNPSA